MDRPRYQAQNQEPSGSISVCRESATCEVPEAIATQKSSSWFGWAFSFIITGPKDHISIRMLQIMVSGILLVLGLGTRMSDPYVYVVFWTLNYAPTPRIVPLLSMAYRQWFWGCERGSGGLLVIAIEGSSG